MAVPKKRTTKSKRDKRRLHIFLKKPSLAKCPKCGEFILQHTVCSFCGSYKKREVIDVLSKMTKKEKKKREKEIRVKEKEGEEVKMKRPLSWQGLSKKQ